MAAHGDEIYFDSNSNGDDDIEEIYHDCSDEESESESESNGEKINSRFIDLVDTHPDGTGTILEEKGVMNVQMYLLGEFYYASLHLLKDQDWTINLLVSSADTRTLCNITSLIGNQPKMNKPLMNEHYRILVVWCIKACWINVCRLLFCISN